MDFLDPIKQKAHARRLALGYAIIGLVLVLATTVLLYQAYGFGINREGQVIQNGLVFMSTHPAGAKIYVNGLPYKNQTNTRMLLLAGQYTIQLQRPGYRIWKRAISVEGGIVQRFDYPFLFPASLKTTVTKQYTAPPMMMSLSGDNHWVVLGGVGAPDTFDVYDLSSNKPTAKASAIPPDTLAAGSTTQSWQQVEWAADNRHLLLKRTYVKSGQPGLEYILFDRQDPTKSQNLTILFGFSPTSMEFHGRAADDFYAFDQNSNQLFTVSLKQPTPTPYASDVLAFASDGDNVIYITDQTAPTGKVLVRLRHNTDTPVTLRQLPVDPLYLVELGTYSGHQFALAGSSAEGKVYVYKDPVAMLKDTSVLIPQQILKVNNPTYVSFSPNRRMMMAESSDHFAVYDAEKDKGYAYQIPTPLDTPMVHAAWMDGYHLTVTSAAKLIAFDYDGGNLQKLAPSSAAFLPAFDHDYRYMYLINSTDALTSTGLLIPSEL